MSENDDQLVADAVATLLKHLPNIENLDNSKKDGEYDCSLNKEEVKVKKKIRRPYIVEGRQVWITGNNEQEVCERFAEALMEAKGITPKETKRVMLCDIADLWFDHKRNIKGISAQTEVSYNNHLNTIKKHFAGKMVDQITWTDVQAFLDKYSNMSKSTVRHKRIILGQILQWAVDDGLISVNPSKDKRIVVAQKQRKRKMVPISDYIDMVTNLHKIKNTWDRSLFGLIALTGMRRGEALALQWKDVDWENGVININSAVSFDGNRPIVGTPKSDAGTRSYPLIDALYNLLFPTRQATGFIASRDGVSPMSETGYTRAWERICKQVNTKKYTAHQFRHTVASILASSPDISPKTTQSMLGHADFATTMDIYAETEVATTLNAGRIFTNILAKSLTS